MPGIRWLYLVATLAVGASLAACSSDACPLNPQPEPPGNCPASPAVGGGGASGVTGTGTGTTGGSTTVTSSTTGGAGGTVGAGGAGGSGVGTGGAGVGGARSDGGATGGGAGGPSQDAGADTSVDVIAPDAGNHDATGDGEGEVDAPLDGSPGTD